MRERFAPETPDGTVEIAAASTAGKATRSDPARDLRARTTALELSYGPELRLRFPDLTVRSGDELVLLGPSGSGKTTLLHILAGLLRPSAGQVEVAGADLGEMPSGTLERYRARHVGLVFQDFHLVSGYSARDNVTVALAAAGASLREAARRAEALLRELDLGHRLDHAPDRLSTGERQRVAIARAVATRPALLLADEPTANLDRARAGDALELLRRAAREAGAALIVATHDPLVTDTFAQHVHVG